jgi:hypothetical protein
MDLAYYLSKSTSYTSTISAIPVIFLVDVERTLGVKIFTMLVHSQVVLRMQLVTALVGNVRHVV